MVPGRVLLVLLRISVGLQVVVGLAMWTGHWYQLVGMHRANGVLFVLVLWSLAVLALAKGQRRRTAIIAITWGIGIAVLGFTQERLLPGDLHWIVRALHLAVGVAAMPLAGLLTHTEVQAT